MSSKVSNVEARERQRRRQSDSGVHKDQESGAVRTSGQGMNRSQLYGVENSKNGTSTLVGGR